MDLGKVVFMPISITSEVVVKRLLLAALLAIATGCSMDASIDRGSQIIDFLSLGKTSGLVSGSSQLGTATAGGTTYYVQSSVGNYISEIEQKDTSGTYKIYSSVQGAIVSE